MHLCLISFLRNAKIPIHWCMLYIKFRTCIGLHISEILILYFEHTSRIDDLCCVYTHTKFLTNICFIKSTDILFCRYISETKYTFIIYNGLFRLKTVFIWMNYLKDASHISFRHKNIFWCFQSYNFTK